MLNNFAFLYITISPIMIVFLSRAIYVSRAFRRRPRFVEIIFRPQTVADGNLSWLKAGERFLLWWLSIFFVGWLMGVNISENNSKIVTGLLGITIFHICCIRHGLQTVSFNIATRKEGGGAIEENRLFYREMKVFPGFAGWINALITFCDSSVCFLVFLIIIIR